MQFRKANAQDIERILAIMDSARSFQRSQGFTQWEDGYPSRELISDDIVQGKAYVLLDGNAIMAYSVLAVGDAEYDRLGGIWRYSGAYGVIHRMAVAPEVRGKNISAILFEVFEGEYLSRGIRLIRIDTGAENKIMRHLMQKFGYESRGVQQFCWGPRLTYEKYIGESKDIKNEGRHDCGDKQI